MATTRLDIRLDEEVKSRAEKAAMLLGLKSLTEYVVKLMDENATHVIKQHEALKIQDNLFDQFVAACDRAKAPNDSLLEAAKFTKESNFR